MAGGSDCAWFLTTPFAWPLPFAICCDGRSGACNADIADDAVGPDDVELTAWGRAVDIPIAGSDFPGGHSPRVGFFRAAQLPTSDEVPLVPLVWADAADIVDVEEAVEAIEDAEFCRCSVFRGPLLNILLISSGFIAVKPFP